MKQYNIQLAVKQLQNKPVIMASNLPSDYKFVFSEIISALGKFSVTHEFGTYKGEDVVTFKNLPNDQLEVIKSAVDDYNSGRI